MRLQPLQQASEAIDVLIDAICILGGLTCICAIWAAIALVVAVRRESKRADTYRGGPPPQAR